VGPARGDGDPEDVLGGVFVAVLEEILEGVEAGGGGGDVVVAGRVGHGGGEGGAALGEGVLDVLQEQEAEDDVLVFRGVHIVAEEVGGLPEGALEAEAACRFGGLGQGATPDAAGWDARWGTYGIRGDPKAG